MKIKVKLEIAKQKRKKDKRSEYLMEVNLCWWLNPNHKRRNCRVRIQVPSWNSGFRIYPGRMSRVLETLLGYVCCLYIHYWTNAIIGKINTFCVLVVITFSIEGFFLQGRCIKKKCNPTLACHSALTTRCMNVIFT